MNKNQKQIVLNAGKLFTSNIVTTLLSFLTILTLFKFLSVAEFGLFSFILALTTGLISFFDLGLKNMIVSDFSYWHSKKNYQKANSLLINYQKWSLGFIAGISLLLIVSSPGLVYLHPNLNWGTSLIMAFLLMALALCNSISITFYAHSQFKLYAFFQASLAALELILIFIFIYFKPLAWNGLIGYGISLTIAFLLYLPIQLKYLPLKVWLFSRTKGEKKETIFQAHRKIGMLAAALKSFNDILPLIILKAFTNFVAVGIFSAAFKMFQLLLFVPGTIEQVLMPTLPRLLKQKDFKKTYRWVARYTGWINAILCLIAVWLSAPLAQWLFPKYMTAIPVLYLLTPAAIIYSFASGQRSILFAHQAQKEYFFSLVVSLASLVGIGVPLVLRYESQGMAIAFVISLALTLLYRSLLISRLNSAKIKKKS